MSQWDVCPSCNLQVDWTSGAGLFMIWASASTPAASRPSVLNLAIQSPAPQWKEAMPWFIQCAVTLACWSPEFETGKPSLEHKHLMLAMQEGEVNLPNNTRGDFQCTKKKAIFLWDPHIMHWFYKPKEKWHSDRRVWQESWSSCNNHCSALHCSKVSKSIPLLSRTKCFVLFFLPVV